MDLIFVIFTILKPPKYLRLIESGDFHEAKIRITHLESLVGGSKPFLFLEWAWLSIPFSRGAGVLLSCAVTLLRGHVKANIYCSAHPTINTCPLCTNLYGIFHCDTMLSLLLYIKNTVTKHNSMGQRVETHEQVVDTTVNNLYEKEKKGSS